MKKLLCSIVFSLAIISFVQAQKDKMQMTYVDAGAKLKKFHNESELKTMNKLDLTQLYMERVSVLTELIPYVALHTKPGATIREMGIPETKQNLEHLEAEVKNKSTYLAAVKNTLDDIIPYADSQEIIWAILFYEDIIRKSELGRTEATKTSVTPVSNSNQE